MLLDALKGTAAVAVGWAMAAGGAEAAPTFWPMSLALLGAIAGHNFNPWLSLKAGRLAGGKGLATAAGGFLLLMPLLVPIWAALFFFGRRAFAAWRGVRDTIPGNVIATALVPLAAWVLYGTAALAVVLVLAGLVLPKHAGQMRMLLRAPENAASAVDPNSR
jgi:glycerol-3-phosphate acyltransferase PlsY